MAPDDNSTPLQTMSYWYANTSNGSEDSSVSNPPCGIEKGLWLNSICPDSGFRSYIGKSTVQQKRNEFFSSKSRSLPRRVRTSPTKLEAASYLSQTKKTESPAPTPVLSFILSWAEENLFSWVDPKIRNTSNRDYKWLESIWLRNQYMENCDRTVGKLFSLSANLPEFLERFPDSKILYIIRDPLSVIPSGLSLVTGVLDKKFDFWKKS